MANNVIYSEEFLTTWESYWPVSTVNKVSPSYTQKYTVYTYEGQLYKHFQPYAATLKSMMAVFPHPYHIKETKFGISIHVDAATKPYLQGLADSLSDAVGKPVVLASIYGNIVSKNFKLQPVVAEVKKEPKSQKIAGIIALKGVMSMLGFGISTTSVDPKFIASDEDLEAWNMFPVFARGCPVNPRHGFVDSVKVNSTEELREVWKKVREADPEGELMGNTYIDAKLSGVWTPTSMTIGTGHDGATAGRDALTIPLVEGEWLNGGMADNLRKKARIADGEVPYMEVVYQKSGGVVLTQYRSGPKITAVNPDLVFEPTVVLEVVEATGDLLEWEAKAKEFKPGTVVWHPGGALTTHYSVHCFNHKIPILVTRKPVIGETLEPTKLEEVDVESFISGIVKSHEIRLDRSNYVVAVHFILTALHNAVVLGGQNSWILGAACALMCRIGAGLSFGELRHSNTANSITGPFVKGLSRDQVYERAINDYWVYRLLLTSALFGYRGFQWPGGFGGAKWADCAESSILLDNAVLRVVKERTKNSVKALIDQLNSTINKAHNNGWWLNKMVTMSTLEWGSKGWPGVPVTSAPLAYKIFHSAEKQATKDLLLELDPLSPKIKVKTVKVKREVEFPTDDPVPQIYDLSYPNQTSSVIKRVQIRPLSDGSMRWQVICIDGTFNEGGFKPTTQADRTKTALAFNASGVKLYPSRVSGPSVQYAAAEVKALDPVNSGVLFIDCTFGGVPFRAHINKPSYKKVEWWKPGVKIPFSHTPNIETKTIEFEEAENNPGYCVACNKHFTHCACHHPKPDPKPVELVNV